MRVLVTGSTGLIGTELVKQLGHHDHRVVRLTRRRGLYVEPYVLWDPDGWEIDQEHLEGFDAVVHLAGENIGAGRWDGIRKHLIRESRVRGTQLLAEKLLTQTHVPHTFISASAVNYYGDRGDERLTEDSPPGEGFLAEVCQAWEAACEPLRKGGVRVLNLRFGVVLSPRGGALARMLGPFRWGVGGRLGHGRQWMSWVTLADAVGAILHCLEQPTPAGPVNVCSPTPVRNREFVKTLGSVLGRPTILPAPVWALRRILGELADEALLASVRMQPARLRDTDYTFEDPDLEGGLVRLLED